MVDFLLFDMRLSRFLANLFPHTPGFDFLWSAFSGFGLSLAIWLVIIVVVLYSYEVRHEKFILVCVVGLLLTNGLVYGIKYTVQRERPVLAPSHPLPTPARPPARQGVWWIVKTIQDPHSFPSAHAANAFFCSGLLVGYAAKNKKKKKPPNYISWLYFVAVLVAYSRIYLQAHYFSDVVVGGIIGFLVAKLIVSSKIWASLKT